MPYLTILPNNQTLFAENGDLLLDVLAKHGLYISAPCGGKGSCGKCKVKLISGAVDGVTADEKGDILACKARIKSDITLRLSSQAGTGLNDFSWESIQGDKDGFGVVLDIGTTTLALCLIHLSTGKVIEKISALNPQAVYGADVLSRIQACNEGKLPELQKCILQKTDELIQKIAGGKEIEELIVCANTTMLHIFLGINPQSIGVAPFIPVFTEMQICTGKELNLPVRKVKLLPSASAYIGSDITAGAYACGMHETEKTVLLVDIGTNGEIVLSHKGKLYASSTSAGPALEGACIERGIGGVSGAVDRVYTNGVELCVSTIDNEKAIGICGSGLIDIIALLIKEKLIDETGAFVDDSDSRFSSRLFGDKFYINDSVWLSQKDIRQVQLAKSAILAGIETLLEENGITIGEVDELLLAGGLAYYMNIENACAIGLLPKVLQDRTRVVGNTALAGSRLCVLQETACQKLRTLAKEMQIVELANSKTFQERYIENMYFPQE